MAGYKVIHALVWRKKWKRPRQWAPKRSFLLHVFRVDCEFQLWYRPRWGYRPGSFRRRVDGEWSPLVEFPRPEFYMKKKEPKKAAPGQSLPTTLASMDTEFFKGFPNLLAHCSVIVYEDGTPRKPGTVQMSTHGPMWQFRAKDPDGRVQLTCVALRCEDALAELDMLLGSDDAPWEVDHYATGGGPGKKK